MIVLGVGDGAHDALAHVLGDALPRELEIGERLVDLLAADQAGDKIELLGRDPEVLRHRARLVVSEASFTALFAHYFFPTAAFLSPPWPWKARVGANSPNLWPIMSSETLTGMCFWPLWTPNVRPTNCGRIVERRLQVLMTLLRPDERTFSAFLRT